MSRPPVAADHAAIALSGLCLVHCLALPVIAASLPLAGVLAEWEWVHKALVILALPISVSALLRHPRRTEGGLSPVIIMSGFALMIPAAFIATLHDHAQAMTLAGAVLVAGGHLLRQVAPTKR